MNLYGERRAVRPPVGANVSKFSDALNIQASESDFWLMYAHTKVTFTPTQSQL